MIKIRKGVFETNSSSSHSLVARYYQVEGLEIPPTVYLTETMPVPNDMNGIYTLFVYREYKEAFYSILFENGVQRIFVDNQEIPTITGIPHNLGFPTNYVLAVCFGEHDRFFEVDSWGDYDTNYGTHRFGVKEVLLLEALYSNPNYVVQFFKGFDGDEVECSFSEWKEEHSIVYQMAHPT
jgi:hypothetical protein